jgi:alkyl hydroperoxide reductase subunit AhpC
MFRVGFPAPQFDCSAVVAGRLVRLSWQQVHGHRPLVLLFDQFDRTAPLSDYLLAIADAPVRRVANIAVVCHNDLYETLTWVNRPGSESVAVPLVVDPAGRVAALYGFPAIDGGPLWGHVVIDPSGIIRELAVGDFPLRPSVEELLRSVQASGFPADTGLRN